MTQRVKSDPSMNELQVKEINNIKHKNIKIVRAPKGISCDPPKIIASSKGNSSRSESFSSHVSVKRGTPVQKKVKDYFEVSLREPTQRTEDGFPQVSS